MSRRKRERWCGGKGGRLPGILGFLILSISGPLGCLAGADRGPSPLPPGLALAAGQPSANEIPDPPTSPTASPGQVPGGSQPVPIDLGTALELAGADNPTIALADEAVQASLAEQLRARVLLVPTLDAGVNVDVHQGNLQSSQGIMMKVDRQALFLGAGAGAVGAGTVAVPGVRITAYLADALFEPRAARQQVAGSRFTAQATRNQVLLEVAAAYFALAGAEARLQALRKSRRDIDEVARLTANFARVGQGRQGDADRAQSEALLVLGQAARTEGEVAAARAELARLLDLDPSRRLQTAEGFLPLVHLVDLHEGPEPLIAIALANRPELGAAAAVVAVAETHLRQERLRPLLPLVSAGFSAGDFGGGSNLADTPFGHFSGRTDVDVLAVWSLQNLGLGNRAVQDRWRSAIHEAEAERIRLQNLVRREVAQAYARADGAHQQVEVVRRQIATAAEGYRLDLIRSKNLEGRPIEVLNSFTLLNAARLDLIEALVRYDQAQFALLVAMGQPPLPQVANSYCAELPLPQSREEP